MLQAEYLRRLLASVMVLAATMTAIFAWSEANTQEETVVDTPAYVDQWGLALDAQAPELAVTNIHGEEVKRESIIEALGVKVAAVSYDSPETNSDFATDNGLTFPVLSDQDAQTVNDFEIRNTDYDEGHFAYGIPHPGIVLIDQNGKIAMKMAESNYRQRPSLDLLIENLKEALSKTL